jgi:hypothetical protein
MKLMDIVIVLYIYLHYCRLCDGSIELACIYFGPDAEVLHALGSAVRADSAPRRNDIG